MCRERSRSSPKSREKSEIVIGALLTPSLVITLRVCHGPLADSCEHSKNQIGFEVLTAVSTKTAVFLSP
jgi:hypothetical protein